MPGEGEVRQDDIHLGYDFVVRLAILALAFILSIAGWLIKVDGLEWITGYPWCCWHGKGCDDAYDSSRYWMCLERISVTPSKVQLTRPSASWYRTYL
jgi:hypothetical protein